MKYLALALLLSAPCLGGITKNMKPHGGTSCGVWKATAKRIYRFKVNTGNPAYDDTIECDGGQLFHVKDKGWTNAADLKEGNAILSDILKTTERSVWFPISNIETIDKDTETFTIRDCPLKERPISKAWIRTINMYHVPGKKCEKLNTDTLNRYERLRNSIANFECENQDMSHNDPDRYNTLMEELISDVGRGHGGRSFGEFFDRILEDADEVMHQH